MLKKWESRISVCPDRGFMDRFQRTKRLDDGSVAQLFLGFVGSSLFARREDPSIPWCDDCFFHDGISSRSFVVRNVSPNIIYLHAYNIFRGMVSTMSFEVVSTIAVSHEDGITILPPPLLPPPRAISFSSPLLPPFEPVKSPYTDQNIPTCSCAPCLHDLSSHVMHPQCKSLMRAIFILRVSFELSNIFSLGICFMYILSEVLSQVPVCCSHTCPLSSFLLRCSKTTSSLKRPSALQVGRANIVRANIARTNVARKRKNRSMKGPSLLSRQGKQWHRRQ